MEMLLFVVQMREKEGGKAGFHHGDTEDTEK
jgi:hypothetical protein